MPVFRYKRFDIYYELHGEPSQPVVTLVNGLSMRTSHWAPYFELLPKHGCRVLAYDMLGQGYSSKPILGVDFDDHATMLHALHRHLDIDRPYVAGISFGGVVVLKYAYMYPERIGGLIPISTFSELDAQLAAHAYNLYTGLARVGFEFYLDLLMPLNFTNEWLEKNRQYMELIKRVGVSTNELYGIQNLMESLQHFDSITHELGRIVCPTLILNAEFDRLTPRRLHDIMRAGIANSRLLLVQHLCHAFTLEEPAITSRLLADFVEKVESGTWRGDQSVWIAADDPTAAQLWLPCEGDHTRGIPWGFTRSKQKGAGRNRKRSQAPPAKGPASARRVTGKQRRGSGPGGE